MARKLRGFERVLDAPSLFAVAYGEIASSLYIALGIVAAAALGLTPLVLLLTGLLFFVVSLSYAEGTAALPETGGAATFVRRAFSDLAGFLTGWALFLDFLIVMALSALFVPHYLAETISVPELRDEPWDAVAGCGLIAGIAAVRLVRRTRLHVGSLAVALLDLLVQAVLVVLGLAFLLSPEMLSEGLGFERGQDWGDLAFALPLAMLAYTGLETVANLAEEAREPGRTLPRSLFSAIGLVVVVTVLIAGVGLSAFPVSGGETALGEEWLEAPLVGIAAAFEGSLPALLVDVLRVAVGISGALILVAAATTSVTGITRLTYSLAGHGSLPREFARLERRALVSSEAILIAAALAIGLIVLTEVVAGGDPQFLAAIYSFGVLIAFTAAQLAVIGLRVREPALTRPFVARPNISVRGVALPLPALVGAPVTLVVWVLALVTHPGARYAGPLWLAAGLVVFVVVRRSRRRGLLEQVAVEALPPGAEFARILVPMKLGDIGEEMLATAIALAKESGAEVEAITVVRVPRRYELEGPLPPDVAARVDTSLEEAR
ncbi:MAG: amino acid permease, partial [Gaiellaceae bacterium]